MGPKSEKIHIHCPGGNPFEINGRVNESSTAVLKSFFQSKPQEEKMHANPGRVSKTNSFCIKNEPIRIFYTTTTL
jgi:hypothetical protein